MNVFRQRGTLAAVIRVIRFGVPDPASLGIPESVLSLADNKTGLVLVTGAAGSGKSTTLACMIDRINRSREAHIITMEDPLEDLHSPNRSIVSQREIFIDTPGYLDSLRSALRESPDVILLGEMRDFDTISAELEKFSPELAIHNMIREGKLHQLESAMQAASADGMVTMDTSLLDLYRKGEISKDTLLTCCNNYEFMVKKVGA